MQHKVLFVLSKSLFPQSCVSSVINPTGLQSQILWEFSVPLLDPQVGRCVMGPRTFLTVWEFLWYNCSAVCGLSAWWLYGGANGDFLQEGLCHTLCGLGLLQQEPLPLWQATADLCLHRRYSNTPRLVWLSLCGVCGCSVHKSLFQPSKHLWWVWGLILDMIWPLLPSCWGFSFALGCGASFFGGIQHSPQWLFISKLQFWSSCRRRWAHVLLLCHLAPSIWWSATLLHQSLLR